MKTDLPEEKTENTEPLSVSKIKGTLDELGRDRNWLAQSIGRSLSTVNGWLSAGKPIPNDCLEAIRIIFIKEHIIQDSQRKTITAASNEEWNKWKGAATQSSIETVQEWARIVLNSEASKSLNVAGVKSNGQVYGNPKIFPIDKKTERFWELVFGYTIINDTPKSFTYKTPPFIYAILNDEAKLILQSAVAGSKGFSLKTAQKASIEYATVKDFEDKRKMFVFKAQEVFLWQVAAALAGESKLNDWANKVIDKNVEHRLLNDIGATFLDDGIPF